MVKNMSPLYVCKLKDSDMYLNHRDRWCV